MAKWDLDNMFVTDTSMKPMNNDTTMATDLQVAMDHPRAKMITMNAEGDIFIELSDVVASNAPTDVIRKVEGLHKSNKTGFRGVSVRGNKYRADISKNGTQFNLGTFDTFSEAVEARLGAEMEASL